MLIICLLIISVNNHELKYQPKYKSQQNIECCANVLGIKKKKESFKDNAVNSI